MLHGMQVLANSTDGIFIEPVVKQGQLEVSTNLCNMQEDCSAQRHRSCRPKHSMTLQELWREAGWVNDEKVMLPNGACISEIESLPEGVVVEVNPHIVFFTHSSISRAFRNGVILDDAIEDILEGKLLPAVFPSLCEKYEIQVKSTETYSNLCKS